MGYRQHPAALELSIYFVVVTQQGERQEQYLSTCLWWKLSQQYSGNSGIRDPLCWEAKQYIIMFSLPPEIFHCDIIQKHSIITKWRGTAMEGKGNKILQSNMLSFIDLCLKSKKYIRNKEY